VSSEEIVLRKDKGKGMRDEGRNTKDVFVFVGEVT
jgi:hypothetical protein